MAIPKIKNVTTFRKDLAENLEEVSNGETIVVTRPSGKEVIVISKENYDEILYNNQVLRDIAIGRAHVAEGKVTAHDEFKLNFKERMSKWKKQK